MPDSTRSSVDLPEPLWPTNPTRSPSAISRLMLSSALTVTTSRAPAITRPPVACATMVFLSERECAPKIANSTVRSRMEMRAKGLDPIGDARIGAAIKEEGGGRAGKPQDKGEGPADLGNARSQQRRADNLEQMVE